MTIVYKKFLDEVMKEYNSFGWVAFHHQRSKTISLNGGREKPIKEQVEEMLRCINLAKSKRLDKIKAS